MRKFLLLIVTLVLMSMPVYGFGPDDSVQTRDFYFSVGLGGSANKYNDESMDPGDTDKTSLFLDFGFYVPTSPKMLFGGVASAAMDRFTKKNSDDFFQITTFLLGGSALYFLDSIEQGLFFRGDLGFATLSVTYEINGVESSSESKWGLGVLGGVGYSLPLDSFSLTGSLLFSHKAIPNKNKNDKDLDVSTVSLSLGLLF